MALGKLDGVLDSNIGKASALTSTNLGKIGGNSISVGYDSYTKLMLHMDGANGSTTFTDSATSKSSTVTGSAQIIDTDGKFNQCGYFSGLSKLSFEDSADWDFGTDDYTIDFWYKTSTSIYDHIIYRLNTYVNIGISQYNNEFRLLISNLDSNNYVVLTATSGCSAADGNWNHIALVRYGSDTDLYFNGTSKLHITTAYEITFSSALTIGDVDLVAKIDELRISKGIARWTTTFTPPSAPY